jgi:hypothetical protein
MGPRAAAVLMPKTALNLYDFPQSREDQIRPARKGVDVQPIAKAHPVDEPAHDHLGRRILASDTPHILTAPLC